MKNQIKNSLSYTGIVTLSQYIGTKKVKIAQIHNTGGASLFEFLEDCFTGNIEQAQLKKPAKIKLLHLTPLSERESDGYRISSASTGFIGLYSQPPASQSNSAGCHITYSFLIHRDQLDSLAGMSNLGLGLYPFNTENTETGIYEYIALCKLNFSNSTILSSSSLIVDWELIVSNSTN